MTLLQLRLLILLELLFVAVGVHAALMLLDWDRVPVEEVRAMPHGFYYIGLLESRAWFVNGFLVACSVLAALLAGTSWGQVLCAARSVQLHWLAALLLPIAYLFSRYNAV